MQPAPRRSAWHRHASQARCAFQLAKELTKERSHVSCMQLLALKSLVDSRCSTHCEQVCVSNEQGTASPDECPWHWHALQRYRQNVTCQENLQLFSCMSPAPFVQLSLNVVDRDAQSVPACLLEAVRSGTARERRPALVLQGCCSTSPRAPHQNCSLCTSDPFVKSMMSAGAGRLRHAC